MDFVDDVDPVPPTKGGELDVFADLAYIVHACIGRPIDLHDIDGRTLRDFEAVGTGPAGCTGRALFAIERLRANSCDRGRSHAAGSGKERGGRNSLRGDGIDQRLNTMRLSDYVIEGARPVLSGRDLIIHVYR